MMKRFVLGLLLTLASPAYAEGLDLAPIRQDLDRAMNSNGKAVWLIYGAVSREKIDEAIKVLAPIKSRVTVGVYGDDFMGEDAREAFKAAGLKVCSKWGRDNLLTTLHKPNDDGDLNNNAMFDAKIRFSETDALIFEEGSRQLETIAGEWEMGGTMPGGAKKNFFFANILSAELDGEAPPSPTRITDDAKVGGVSGLLSFEGGRGCFEK